MEGSDSTEGKSSQQERAGKPEDKACIFPFWICPLFCVFTDFSCFTRYPFVHTSPDHRRSIGRNPRGGTQPKFG